MKENVAISYPATNYSANPMGGGEALIEPSGQNLGWLQWQGCKRCVNIWCNLILNSKV